MGFRPLIAPNLKPMDARIFQEPPMNCFRATTPALSSPAEFEGSKVTGRYRADPGTNIDLEKTEPEPRTYANPAYNSEHANCHNPLMERTSPHLGTEVQRASPTGSCSVCWLRSGRLLLWAVRPLHKWLLTVHRPAKLSAPRHPPPSQWTPRRRWARCSIQWQYSTDSGNSWNPTPDGGNDLSTTRRLIVRRQKISLQAQ